MSAAVPSQAKRPWNKGMLVGRKAPFKPKDVGASGTGCNSKPNARTGLLDVGIEVS